MRSWAALVVVVAACGGDGQLPADAPAGNDTPAAAALVVAPALADFGTLTAYTQSSPIRFTIANPGGSATSVAASTSGEFTITATTCASTLAPGGTCTVDVVAIPQGTGMRTGALTAFGDSVVVMAVAQLTVVALNGENGALVPSPSSTDFGDVLVGQPSSPFTFTVTNPGGTPISGLGLFSGGADPAAFTVASNTCGTLAPGAACAFAVAFVPTSTGLKTAQFTLATGASSVAVAVRGTGILAPVALAIGPATQDFGGVGAGSVTGPVIFTVANSGGTAATSLALASSNPAFELVQTTCGATLAAGASCEAFVRFAPTTVGAQSGTLAVTAAGATAVHADLAGTGLAVADLVTISPAPVDFGAVVVGQTKAQVFTVTNVGTTTKPALAFAFTGAAAAELSLAQDTCTGVALAPNGACTVAAVLSPTSVGGKQAVLSANGLATHVGISGSGIATASSLAMSPSIADAGEANPGMTTLASTFTVANHGTTATAPLAATLAGADASQFAVTSDTCAGLALAAGATCTVSVMFSPTTGGVKTASLQVSGGAGATATSFVSGTGVVTVNGLLTVSPNFHDFGTVAQATAPFAFTVTNTSATTMTGLTVTGGGPDVAQFPLADTTCTTLAPGATCTFSVVFAPTTLGFDRSAMFQVTSSTSAAIANVHGTLYLEPNPLSIAPSQHDYGPVGLGQVASFAFTVRNAGGASQTPTVSLGGADGAQFALALDTCTGASVAVGGACTVTVQFAPTTAGDKTAVLRVVKSDGFVFSAPLQGSGVVGDGLLFASPSSVAFPTALIGAAPGHWSFALTNNASAPTGPLAFAYAGDPTQFPFNTDGCTGATLAHGASCAVDLAFAPTSVGAKQLTVTVVGQPAATVALSGAGSFLTVDAIDSRDFGNISIGQTSVVEATFTIRNGGATPAGPLSVVSVGPDPSQFRLTQDTCTGATLAPATTCMLGARFAPTTAGFWSTTYTVSSAAAGAIGATVRGHGY